MSGVIHSKFDVILEVEGIRYDIILFDADFTINQIPMARCSLSVGRKATDGTEFAKIHKNLDEFSRSRNIAKVYFCPKGQWSEENNWPEGEHLVFEGRIVGVGIHKQQGKMQMTAHLQHWLGDLNFSSTMSAQSHPTNPSQFTYQATVGNGYVSQTGKPAGLALSAEGKLFGAPTVQVDMWGEALKPMLCAMATADHLQFHSDLNVCFGLEKQENTQALAALSRIEGESELSTDVGKACNRERSCYTPKLALNIEDGKKSPLAIGAAITATVMGHTIQSFENQTIWGKLVGEIGPEFMFSTIPLIDTALVVPVVPGLRDIWCKRIYSCDYDPISFAASIVRPIRGVAICGGRTSLTGVLEGGNSRAGYALLGIGGCWAPEDQVEGQVLIKRAPKWLDSIGSTGIASASTIGLDGDPPGATTPKDEDEDDLLGREDEDKTTESLIRNVAQIFVNYAHCLYVFEALRGRNGNVGGKLRFDIAPGSTVWIEGTHERFADESDKLGQNMIGLVMRVTVAINAEAGKAGTSFKMTHMRTESENESDATSIDCHPLYVTKFPGAPLSNDLWFRDEGDGCCEVGETDGPSLRC